MVVIWLLLVLMLWAIGIVGILLFKPLQPRRRPWKRRYSF